MERSCSTFIGAFCPPEAMDDLIQAFSELQISSANTQRTSPAIQAPPELLIRPATTQKATSDPTPVTQPSSELNILSASTQEASSAKSPVIQENGLPQCAPTQVRISKFSSFLEAAKNCRRQMFATCKQTAVEPCTSSLTVTPSPKSITGGLTEPGRAVKRKVAPATEEIQGNLSRRRVV